MSERYTALSIPERLSTTIRVIGEHLRRSVRWERIIDVAGGGTGLIVSTAATSTAKPTSDIGSFLMANLLTGPVFMGAGIILGRALTASEKPNVKN